MQSVSGCEYSQSDLIGHGAFALVFRGRKKKVILLMGQYTNIRCMTLVPSLESSSKLILLPDFAQNNSYSFFTHKDEHCFASMKSSGALRFISEDLLDYWLFPSGQCASACRVVEKQAFQQHQVGKS